MLHVDLEEAMRDWERGPLTADSREIITSAQAQ